MDNTKQEEQPKQDKIIAFEDPCDFEEKGIGL